MGIEAIVLLLVGLVGLIGIAGGSDSGDPEPENTDGENLPDGNMQPVDEIREEDEPDPADNPDPEVEPDAEVEPDLLIGTQANDLFVGNGAQDGFDGGAGDDFAVSFGEESVLIGGDGEDFLAARSGETTLTGGAGQDLFFVLGAAGSTTPTIATITDFDPTEDNAVFVMEQNPSEEPGAVAITTETSAISIEERETPNGFATELTIVPRPGFEDALKDVGFPTIIFENVPPDALNDGNVAIGVLPSQSDEELAEFVATLAFAEQNYELYQFGDFQDQTLIASPQDEAVFGMAGSDVLLDNGLDVDLFGGSGGDFLGSDDPTLEGSILDGGPGKDFLEGSVGDTLVGGDGSDVFHVIGSHSPTSFDQPETRVTDFDPSTETLEIFEKLILEDQDGIALGDDLSGVSSVTLTDEVRDGEAGVLVTPIFTADANGGVFTGPKVFLAGASSSDIQEGSISFRGSLDDTFLSPEDPFDPTTDLPPEAADYASFEVGTPSDDTEYSDSKNDAFFGLGGNDTLFVDTSKVSDLYGGSGDDTLYGPEFGRSGYGLFGGDGDDQFFTAGGTEITGGAGADEISVEEIEISKDFTLTETVVTDFEVGVDTLSINATYGGDNFGLDVAASFEGETAVSIDDATRDGVSGTLVTTSFTVDGTTADGPSVFLVGVTAASIPDGAFSFSARSAV